jgi:hypothetical protein
MSLVAILENLLSSSTISNEIARRPELLWKWEGIAKDLSVELESELNQISQIKQDGKHRPSSIHMLLVFTQTILQTI